MSGISRLSRSFVSTFSLSSSVSRSSSKAVSKPDLYEENQKLPLPFTGNQLLKPFQAFLMDIPGDKVQRLASRDCISKKIPHASHLITTRSI